LIVTSGQLDDDPLPDEPDELPEELLPLDDDPDDEPDELDDPLLDPEELPLDEDDPEEDPIEESDEPDELGVSQQPSPSWTTSHLRLSGIQRAQPNVPADTTSDDGPEPCGWQTVGQTTPIESKTVNGQSVSHQRSSSGIGAGQAGSTFDPS
jgi:hypothetical protein